MTDRFGHIQFALNFEQFLHEQQEDFSRSA